MEIIKAKRLQLIVFDSITVDCRNGEIDHMSTAILQMAIIFSEPEKNIIRTREKSSI